jgi:hypothetical protein
LMAIACGESYNKTVAFVNDGLIIQRQFIKHIVI